MPWLPSHGNSIGLLLHAIQNAKTLTGDLKRTGRRSVDALATVKKFDADHGNDGFRRKTGDPNKCAVVVKINPEGKFEFFKSVCP